jgi:hypothetical protein
MRRLRPHLTYANIMVTLLAIGALTGGVAYAADTIGSSDVIDESLLSQDIKNNEVGSADLKNNAAVQSADVRNGTLNDEDVGEMSFVSVGGNIGFVAAGACSVKFISGIGTYGDHLLLTPSQLDAAINLDYTARYTDTGSAAVQVCNPTDSGIDDETTHFNLLVFDADQDPVLASAD